MTWYVGRRGVKDVGGKVGRKVLWYVIGVVRVPAGLASNDGDAAFGVASGQVTGKVEVEEFVVERTAVRGVGGRSGAHGEDFERGDPVKGKLGLEYGGIGAFLGALSDGSSSVVDPRPTAGGEWRRSAKVVHDGCLAVV